jgi:RNA polymerase sigma factor (sigma-70 family)
MSQILALSTSLVESIVSIYNPVDRDDLIQESMLRIQYACKHFNHEKASLHTYFTTVIRNICTTYSGRQGKDLLTDDMNAEDTVIEVVTEDIMPSDDETLCELRQRNRMRFPSLLPLDIDAYTDFIYKSFLIGDTQRTVLHNLVSKFSISRRIALIVYNSTVVYLRISNQGFCKQSTVTDEMSLTTDLKAVIGEEMYAQVIVAFAGINVKFPVS